MDRCYTYVVLNGSERPIKINKKERVEVARIMNDNKKLGLGLLIALGIGSMIGGGIFNSPTDLIGKANPLAALIAWGIGGVGVICLALVFQSLANKKPDLVGGIYSYARAGFGDFLGFNSAWGYWAAGFLGNVAFFVLFFKTLNSLLGAGKELSPMASFILGSAILWGFTYIVSRGTRDAGIMNAVVTAAKLIPLLLVVVLGVFVFKGANFSVPHWQNVIAASGDTSSLAHQIKGAMGTILWCFVGIEAAVVLSARAVSQKIVGKAIVISIFITLAIYVAVSTIAMGVIDPKTLAGASTPLADVLGATFIGGAGAVIVKLGIMVSVMGATLPWIMIVSEIPFLAAKDGIMPKWFAKANKNGIPINSLFLTQGLTQVFLLALLSPKLQDAYYMVYYISTTLVLMPYLFSTLFSTKLCLQKKSFGKDLFVSLIATIYAMYVIYAVGVLYLGLTVVMYAIGVIPFVMARKEKGQGIKGWEWAASAALVLGGIFMVIQIAGGKITP